MAENEDGLQWKALLNALADADEDEERLAREDESGESEDDGDWLGMDWTDNEEDWHSEEEGEHPRVWTDNEEDVNENADAVHEGGGDGREEEGGGGDERELPQVDDGAEELQIEQRLREMRRDMEEYIRDMDIEDMGIAMREPGQRIAIRIVEEQWVEPLPPANRPNDGNQEPPQEARVRIRVNGEDWIDVHPQPANPNPMNPPHHHFWPAGFVPPVIVPPPVPQGEERAPMGAAPPPRPPHLHQPDARANPAEVEPMGPQPVPRLHRAHFVEPRRDPRLQHHQQHHPHVHADLNVPPGFNPPAGGGVIHHPHFHELHVWIGRFGENVNGQRNGGGDGGRAVTQEMIREAEALREEDSESDPSPTRFSRACHVCAIENPKKRAAFIRCGHVICYPCAVANARSNATEGKCVICRAEGGFIKLFEDEVRGED